MTSRRLIFAAAGALIATACGSGADGGGQVPGVSSQGLAAEDFSCVQTKPVAPTDLSRALASSCGCDGQAVHVAGTASNIDAVDCSSATLSCVNGVLATNGFLNPPWSAVTTSYSPCITLAVSFDPCGGICRTSPGADGGATGGGDGDGDGDDDGDGDGDGHHHHHHHHYGY